ncbi:unnamed protein product [Vicia faba]|uniref:F-box domain-containing protein n=1 Tax=Vicia faba TaxID=3906 RepID=A0AAV1A9W0_VICFA|nr:unnamed protein product [Vicia faba]
MNRKSTMSRPVFFPDDLIVEIISLLAVKPLVRFKCVSNSWNTLISDPSFEKFHLKRTTRSGNTHFTLITQHLTPIEGERSYHGDWSIIPYPITRLFHNPSSTIVTDSSHYFLTDWDYPGSRFIGSCNGLLCLLYLDYSYTHDTYWFRLWNPATRKISQQFGYSHHSRSGFTFKFACDDSTCTFKVVAYSFVQGRYTSQVKVFTIADNVWKNIDSFPIVPLAFEYQRWRSIWSDGCVFLNSTLNWLAIHKDIQKDLHNEYAPNFHSNWASLIRDITLDDLVIVSLHLGSETYNRFLLPKGFDELPPVEPTISVLGEWLCFSYFHKGTDMVIWKMEKFGIQESWIQFLKISYHVLRLYYDFSYNRLQLLPLFLSKDGDSLILCRTTCDEGEAIIYNWKDNSAQRIEVNVHKTIIDDKNRNYLYMRFANGYVESLISMKHSKLLVEETVKNHSTCFIRGLKRKQ